MRSILHQLSKYKVNQETKEIVVIDNIDQRYESELDSLVEQIVLADYANIRFCHEEDKKRIKKLLADMPHNDCVDILYPQITLARYHLAYTHQYITSEASTDREIQLFLGNQDKMAYRNKFMQHCDNFVEKIVLSRCLLATFDGFMNPCDKIDPKYRKTIMNRLGVFVTKISEAVKLQEQFIANADLHQLILGRFGYIMIWSWINTNTSPNIPLIGYEDAG